MNKKEQSFMYKAKQIFSKRNSWALYFYLTRIEFLKIIRHPGFIILSIVTISFLNSNYIGNVVGSAIYPTTGFFINQIPLSEFPIIFITLFFSGELVWREKNVNASSIIDTYPVSDLVIFSSKISTLFLIQFFYAIVIVLFGIINQWIIFNYSDVNIALYIKSVFGIHLLNYWAIAVAFFLIQVLSPNKYMGFLFSGLGLIMVLLLPSLGISNNLFRYGVKPDYRYSEMSGFGPYASLLIWFTIYWSLFACMLFLVSFKLWPRGYEIGRKKQLKNLIKNSSLAYKGIISVFFMLFVCAGIFIASNQSSSLNYLENKKLAEYERDFKYLEKLAIPNIEGISIKADLYPSDKYIVVNGNYILRNNSLDLIDTLLITFHPGKDSKLSLDRDYSMLQINERLGVKVLKLTLPLKPGEAVSITFKYKYSAAAFNNKNPNIDLIENGLLLTNFNSNSTNYFPEIGYNNYREIRDSTLRKEYGLKQNDNMHEITKLGTEKLKSLTDWVKYNAILSTSTDQVAITNGNLVKSWTSNDRKYYEYKTDTLINNEIAITSGKFKLTSKEVNGISYKIFYSPDHNYNIDQMLEGSVEGIKYCENNFGKYPNKSFTIVEIPNYHRNLGNAFSIPTLILWNEDGGFFNLPNKKGKINRVFSTAVHEASHQWWAHAVKPASFVPGGIVLNETLAQYTRLMLLNKNYSQEAYNTFLKDERAQYFYARSIAIDEEKSLSNASQPYVAYNKGSLVMNSIKNLIGEEDLNTSLRQYYEEFAYKDSLFATTKDLELSILSFTPDSIKPYIYELFCKTNIYDSKIISAKFDKTGNSFELSFNIEVNKYEFDNSGNETEINFDGYIPVTIYRNNKNILEARYYRYKGKETSYKILLHEIPASIIADPNLIYIDKDLDNNRYDISINYSL